MTMFSGVLFLYSLTLGAVLVAGLPYWLLRMATAAKYREGLTQRLGAVPKTLERRGGEVRTIWVHAVSVGEVTAVTELVKRLACEGYRIVVSTTTRTGQRLARERFGEANVFYFPLDLARIVRRYLTVLEPRLLVLVETEFWPNLLAECGRDGIPIAVVNARISDRSYPRYLRLRRLWKPLLGALSVVLAQSEVDAERLRAIGVPVDRVRMSGNLKFDVRPAPVAAVTTALREHLPPGMRLVVCGSTIEGEEAMLIEAWTRLGGVQKREWTSACMVLAPRHPERFPAVAKLLDQSGVPWVRRTEWMHAPERLRPGSVFLLNSIGELASVYSLASVAFVGGSLVAAGGHNPLEPAQFGVPVVMGPHYSNFRTIVTQLLAKDAIRIVEVVRPVSGKTISGKAVSGKAVSGKTVPGGSHGDGGGDDQLTRILAALLSNPDEAAALGARAQAVFRSESGATTRAVEALLLLASAESSRDPAFGQPARRPEERVKV